MKRVILCLLLPIAIAAQTRNVSLTWEDKLNPAGTMYNVYFANAACSPAPSTFIKLTATPIANKNYTHTAVLPGVYCYQVTAVNSAFAVPESQPSNLAGAEVPLAAPTGLTSVVATATVTVSPDGALAAKLEVRTVQQEKGEQ